MDKSNFLMSLTWLQFLQPTTVVSLRQEMNFQTLLSNALCSFVLKSQKIEFLSSVAQPDAAGMFKFSILLSSNEKTRVASALYFVFDDDVYLVNHPYIGNIAIPKKHSGSDPAVHMIFQPYKLKIWFPIVPVSPVGTHSSIPAAQDVSLASVAHGKLISAMEAMNTLLSVNTLRHPALPKQRHLPVPVSSGESNARCTASKSHHLLLSPSFKSISSQLEYSNSNTNISVINNMSSPGSNFTSDKAENDCKLPIPSTFNLTECNEIAHNILQTRLASLLRATLLLKQLSAVSKLRYSSPPSGSDYPYPSWEALCKSASDQVNQSVRSTNASGAVVKQFTEPNTVDLCFEMTGFKTSQWLPTLNRASFVGELADGPTVDGGQSYHCPGDFMNVKKRCSRRYAANVVPDESKINTSAEKVHTTMCTNAPSSTSVSDIADIDSNKRSKLEHKYQLHNSSHTRKPAPALPSDHHSLSIMNEIPEALNGSVLLRDEVRFLNAFIQLSRRHIEAQLMTCLDTLYPNTNVSVSNPTGDANAKQEVCWEIDSLVCRLGEGPLEEQELLFRLLPRHPSTTNGSVFD